MANETEKTEAEIVAELKARIDGIVQRNFNPRFGEIKSETVYPDDTGIPPEKVIVNVFGRFDKRFSRFPQS